MMKKCLTLLAAISVITVFAESAKAEEKNSLGFDISADFFSKYIWRGQVLTDDPVFQGGASATYGGLSAGIWGNLDLTSANGESGEFTEVDYFGEYAFEIPGIDGVGFAVGFVNYHFPGVTGDTSEIYWSAGIDMPLKPSVSVSYDIDEIDGIYTSFAIGHDFGTILEVAENMPVAMEFGASLGIGDEDYNNGYWGTDDSGLNDLALSLAFPMEIGGWSVTPSVNYVTLVDSDIRSSDHKSSDYFYSGISFAKSF